MRADYISRAFILTIAAVNFVLLVAGRMVLLGGSRRLRDKLQRFHYCLIVGLGQNARELASLIEQSEPMGLRLIGFVDPGTQAVSRISGLKSQYPVFALADAYGILQNHVVDELLFAVNNDELERLCLDARNVKAQLNGREAAKVVVVPNKLVNIVVR